MPTLDPQGYGAGVSFDWTEDYQESNGIDGTIITAGVHTDWSRTIIRQFPAGMLSTCKTEGNGLQRTLPEAHVSKQWLHATSCELTGGIGYLAEEANKHIRFLARTDGVPQAAKATWSVQWSYLGYDLASDQFKSGLAGNGKELCRYVSRKVQPSIEALPIPGTEWKFSSDGQKISEPTTTLLALKDLEYTWWWIPWGYRIDTWDPMLGKVNNATFDGRGRGSTRTSYPSYATGTVYFAGYEQTEAFYDPIGNLCCHTTFFFKYRAAGWNKFYKPGSGFASVEAADGSGRLPFATDDLMQIFD